MILPSLENLCGTLIHSISWAHLAHFAQHGVPGSYAAHLALQEYYEEMPELADALIEKMLGAQWIDNYDDVSLQLMTPEKPMPYQDPLYYMMQLRAFVVNARNNLMDPDQFKSMNSLVDDIINQLDSTIYKLRRLK